MRSLQARVLFVTIAAQHLEIRDALLAGIGRVLDGGMYVLRQKVEAFERHFAEFSGVRYGVGSNSGADALILHSEHWVSVLVDGVIATANSFTASGRRHSSIGNHQVLPIRADNRHAFRRCLSDLTVGSTMDGEDFVGTNWLGGSPSVQRRHEARR